MLKHAARGLRFEEDQGEPLFLIEPLLDDAQTRMGGEGVDFRERILVRAFRVDLLVCGQRHIQVELLDADGLRASADLKHLHHASVLIIPRFVSKRLEVEITAELAVDAAQDIGVERRGHAGGVVVGLFEHGSILAQVDPDEHAIVLREARAGGLQKRGGGGPRQIPDARPQPGQALGAFNELLNEGKPVVILSHVGPDAEPLESIEQLLGSALQGGTGDVHRHVEQPRVGAEQRGNEHLRFVGTAAAEFGEVHPMGHESDDSIGVPGEDFAFGARGIVLRELANPLEKLGADFVVDEPTGESLGRGGQARAHVGGERCEILTPLLTRKSESLMPRGCPDAHAILRAEVERGRLRE